MPTPVANGACRTHPPGNPTPNSSWTQEASSTPPANQCTPSTSTPYTPTSSYHETATYQEHPCIRASVGARVDDAGLGGPLWSPIRTNLRRMTKQGSI